MDGPGGTCKTFLHDLLLADVRSGGDVALAVASSGLAALLLTGGRTAYSRFSIPPEGNNCCNSDNFIPPVSDTMMNSQ